MSETYKCPICGETEHFPVEPFSNGGYQKNYLCETWGDTGINARFSAFICKKCGHVDLFAPEIAQRLSEAQKIQQERISKAETALKEVKAKRQTALAAVLEEEERLNHRLAEITPLLASDEITIKQHRQLEEENNKIEVKLAQIAQKKAPWDSDLREAEGELERAKLNY